MIIKAVFRKIQDLIVTTEVKHNSCNIKVTSEESTLKLLLNNYFNYAITLCNNFVHISKLPSEKFT